MPASFSRDPGIPDSCPKLGELCLPLLEAPPLHGLVFSPTRQVDILRGNAWGLETALDPSPDLGLPSGRPPPAECAGVSLPMVPNVPDVTSE